MLLRYPTNTPDEYVHTDVVRVWAVRCLHTGVSLAGVSKPDTTDPFDGPYIRCWEEVPYVRTLERYVGKLLQDPSGILRKIFGTRHLLV